MTTMSKRAQARTERELQDLLRQPGNATCADCGARNPSWASWNLGVFLCMRCASIHRKLGTHISKVKSLSMDTWSNDQVENMKKYGNTAVNTEYNPKNRRPDMPLDADEVDSAMERFIRKKYQEKSLSDGKPEVPSRDNLPPGRSQSPDASPPPVLPSKKSRFFGFGLRASSSAYPLSKHDKKHRNEPRVDSAFRIASDNLDSPRRPGGSRTEVSDHDLQVKLAQLRDMGFTNNEQNTNILKRHNGDVERTIASLVKLGPNEPLPARRTTPTPVATRSNQFPDPVQTSVSAPQSAVVSQNPFEQTSQSANSGLTYGGGSAPQTATINTNPWQNAISNSPTPGLEQSFSNLQVSQPLFPNTTGGYPGQPQFASQTIPQPMQISQQQYAVTSSPVSMNNPFMQAPLSAHSTGSNPYASHMQGIPSFAPSTNPFLNAQSNQPRQQSNSNQSFNPFGLPPSDSPPRAQTLPFAQQSQQSPNFSNAQQGFIGTSPNTSSYAGTQFVAQQQFMQPSGQQSPPAMLGFQYGQSQPQAQPQQVQVQYQQQYQQPYPQPPTSPNTQLPYNPYMQQPQQPQIQQQQQPLMAQQTGLMDKKSILALYNYPQLAPSKPLASIPEPSDEQNQAQQAYGQQQFISPAPSGAIYNNNNGINPAKRSATMPASSMHSASGMGSRNPFMTSTNSSASSTPMMGAQQFGSYPQGARHASQESVAVNNQNLQDGRHSPDAFASLSARYVR